MMRRGHDELEEVAVEQLRLVVPEDVVEL